MHDHVLHCRARTSDRPPRSLPGALSGEDAGDPPGLREQVDALFLQWAQLSEEQPAEKAHNGFVGQLQQAGFLKARTRPHSAWQWTSRLAHDKISHGREGPSVMSLLQGGNISHLRLLLTRTNVRKG